MPSPIILHFDAAESLCSVDTFAIVGGVAWGTVTAPLTPLNFSSENFAQIFGSTSTLAANTSRYSQETLYREWDRLTQENREIFYDTANRLIIRKGIYGAALGIQVGGPVNAAADAIEELLENLARRFLVRIITGIGLDSLQSSQSTISTLYGINGVNTYEQNIRSYSNTATNICILQGSMGCLALAGLNIVFFGNFPSWRSLGIELLLHPNSFTQSVIIGNYLRSVFANALSVAFVGDAAFGLILPGAQLQLMAT